MCVRIQDDIRHTRRATRVDRLLDTQVIKCVSDRLIPKDFDGGMVIARGQNGGRVAGGDDMVH